MFTRLVTTFVFVAQSAWIPGAYADGGPSVRKKSRGIKCLAKYYKDDSQVSRDAQQWLNDKAVDCRSNLSCITKDICPDLETYLDTKTEAGTCPDGNCPVDDVTPATTADTNRSGLDKDSSGEVADPYTPYPDKGNGSDSSPKAASNGGGLSSFFSNPIIMGLGGLALGVGLGYMLWGRSKPEHQADYYPPTGQFYPPRFVPPNYMGGIRTPYGIMQPVPGVNYGGLLGNVYNGAGYGQGGFNGGYNGGQNGQWNGGNMWNGAGANGGQNGQWNGSNQWSGGGNIYNGYPPPVLPYPNI